MIEGLPHFSLETSCQQFPAEEEEGQCSEGRIPHGHPDPLQYIHTRAPLADGEILCKRQMYVKLNSRQRQIKQLNSTQDNSIFPEKGKKSSPRWDIYSPPTRQTETFLVAMVCCVCDKL